jgi:hypothetical protein
MLLGKRITGFRLFSNGRAFRLFLDGRGAQDHLVNALVFSGRALALAAAAPERAAPAETRETGS